MSLGSNPVSIVIIDDNPLSLEYLSTALAYKGMTVFATASPEKGLELIYTHRPQIVLSDVVMPGMSGLDVLECTKRFEPATQVVLMSAGKEPGVAAEAIRKGASEYLSKPVSLALVRACIGRLIPNYRVPSGRAT